MISTNKVVRKLGESWKSEAGRASRRETAGFSLHGGRGPGDRD
jgi:hypothetical protein